MNQGRRTFLLNSGMVLATGMLTSRFAHAQQPGTDYTVIRNGAPSQPGDKVEVLEAFSYMCPHCHEFEPKLGAWLKKLPQDVVYRRLPVVFRDSWAPVARGYYALEAMGLTAATHDKIFEAIHRQSVDLGNDDALFKWIAKQGIDQKKFVDTYKSFGINTKFGRANQLARGYGVSGVPAIIVDGKYQTSASLVGGYDKMLAVTDELIMLSRVERKLAKEKKS